eukprot:m.27699 g.27699  ORF g.27699 m.27699 type:complete len:385 (+) comp11775_c0_seq2:189-1343(+)
MPRRRSSMLRKRHAPGQTRIRDTISACNSDPVDIRTLRALALEPAGFYNSSTRAKAWMALVGARSHKRTMDGIDTHHDAERQVELDVLRSLWRYPEHCPDMERATVLRNALRQRLSILVNAIFAAYPDLHYYQGFHDVVSVCMLTMEHDDAAALEVIKRLVRCHLKDYMAKDMKPTLERLKLVLVLLQLKDPELAQHLLQAGIEPSFAISWVITWFAHEIENLDDLQRLFDFLLASHPLMVLYLSAAVVHQNRQTLLEAECEFTEVYRHIIRIKNFAIEDAIQTAQTWYQETNPQELLRRASLTRAERALAAGQAMDRYPAFLKDIECQQMAGQQAAVFYDYSSQGGQWVTVSRRLVVAAVEYTAVAAAAAATIWITSAAIFSE